MLLRCTPLEGIVTGTDAGPKYAEKYKTLLPFATFPTSPCLVVSYTHTDQDLRFNT